MRGFIAQRPAAEESEVERYVRHELRGMRTCYTPLNSSRKDE